MRVLTPLRNDLAELGKSVISAMLIITMLICTPLEAFAQSSIRYEPVLAGGTQVNLRVTETFPMSGTTDQSMIMAEVAGDVYSADGSPVLVKQGTPAIINVAVVRNGAWGRPGEVCLSSATTRTVDNRQVTLHLASCKNGSNNIGAVIALSVIFFPLGLLSGLIKGGMPKIQAGSTFSAYTTQDIICTLQE